MQLWILVKKQKSVNIIGWEGKNHSHTKSLGLNSVLRWTPKNYIICYLVLKFRLSASHFFCCCCCSTHILHLVPSSTKIWAGSMHPYGEVHKKTNAIQPLLIKKSQSNLEDRSFYETRSANGEYWYSATRILWECRQRALKCWGEKKA